MFHGNLAHIIFLIFFTSSILNCGKAAVPSLDELDFTLETTKVEIDSLRIKPQAYSKVQSYSVTDHKGGGDSLVDGDLLVGINGEQLSELDLQDAISELYTQSKGKRFGKKNNVIFPLVFHDEVDATTGEIPEEGLVVGAFIKIEIVEAKNVTFRPTGKHREDLWAVKEANLARERARLQRELDEKRRIAEEIQAEERRQKERAEKREAQRQVNAQRRAKGEGYTYDAELLEEDEGGLGIFFAEDAERPLVANVLEEAKGFAEGVRKGDALISVNGVDVSKMGLMEVVGVITDADFPKILVFQVFPRGEEVRVQTSFEFFVSSPALLMGQYEVQRPQNWGGNITSFDPCAAVQLGFVNPRTGCKKLTMPKADDGTPTTIIMTVRGECTFVDKARAIQEEGGQMIVVVNTEEKIMDMPAGRMKTEDITTPIAMIGKTAGQNIEAVLRMGYSVEAFLAPQHMCSPITTVLPQMDKPPRLTDDSGGGLVVMSQSFSGIFDFADAMFGPPAKDNVITPIIFADPPDACDPDQYTVRVKGAFVAVDRGTCSFSQKTVIAQQLGATAVVILNNEPRGGVIRVMAPPEDEEIVRIPTVMISKRAADIMRKSVENGDQFLGRFIHTDFEGKYG